MHDTIANIQLYKTIMRSVSNWCTCSFREA